MITIPTTTLTANVSRGGFAPITPTGRWRITLEDGISPTLWLECFGTRREEVDGREYGPQVTNYDKVYWVAEHSLKIKTEYLNVPHYTDPRAPL